MLKCIWWRPVNVLTTCSVTTRRVLLNQQLRSLTVCHESTKSWKQPEGHNTGISIYHPLVKEKVPLVLNHHRLLKWYACGPTVYDSAHIGHASSYVRQDVIRRIFQGAFGIDCFLVMGVTDVDDKIIVKSNEVNQSVEEITSFYESEFFSDMSDLNVLPPSVISRVMDHMHVIIAFIEGLEKQGFAYQASDGSVYFDVNKYGNYGVFSNPIVEEQDNHVKKSAKDFALWKKSKPGEIKWNSPWGEGRPGWHIECSAMASAILGSNFDLHSGGEDLIFPHHENEVAQSCAFHNTHQWVNYWFHTGKLFLSGQEAKMSKSLKNTISVSDFLKSYTPNHFRMLCLLSSYRKRIEFSDERMDKAVSTVNTFNNFLSKCEAYVKGQTTASSDIPESQLYERLEEAKVKVHQAYADDFNTPQALAVLMRLLKFASQVFDETATTGKQSPSLQDPQAMRHPAVVSATSLFIQRHLDLLGLDVGRKKTESSSKLKAQFDDVIDLAVVTRDNIRNVARDKRKFFETAAELDIPKEKAAILMKKTFKPLWSITDDIRTQLLKRADIEVRDGKDGSSWSVVEPIRERKVLPNTKTDRTNK